MRCADGRNTLCAGRGSANHISTISMSVHDSRPEFANQLSNRPVLLEIAAPSNYNSRHLNTQSSQVFHERMGGDFTAKKHCSNVARLRILCGGQHGYNALEPSMARGGEQMKCAARGQWKTNSLVRTGGIRHIMKSGVTGNICWTLVV